MTPYIIIVIGGIIVILTVVILLLFDRKKVSKPEEVSSDSLVSNLNNEKIKSDIILNSIDDGVVLLDKDRVIRLFNPKAGKITGWSVEEATGMDFRTIFMLQNEKGEVYEETENPLYQAYITKTVRRNHHTSLQAKSKSILSLDLTATPLVDTNGEVQGVIAVFRDISDQRKEEQQRADFISTASHEMRTPVAAIEGFLALAMNDKVSKIDDKARGFLEKAHENTKHLGKLFQDLLTSSKAEDGRLENHPSVVEMGEFLTNLVESLKFATDSKGLGIEFVLGTQEQSISTTKPDIIKPLYYVHVDPGRIREVIINLFDNAVKYTSQGKVVIALTGNEAIVQVRIQDTGSGIPSENIQHLFQKFYRIDNSTTRTVGGTGLGLFISRKIIEMYNGRIWAESEVDKGSTFYINLPRISSALADQLEHPSQKQEDTIVTKPTVIKNDSN